MNPRTKIGILTLGVLIFTVLLLRFLNISKQGSLISPNFKIDFSQTFKFDFKSKGLSEIIQKNLFGQKGSFAIFIEDLESGEKYTYHESEIFPAASLYKLILVTAVLKEVEVGQLKLEDTITGRKSHLIQVLGEEDFGYEGVPEYITYSIEEALQRIGRISDNFAAIMLAEKLRELRAGRVDGDKLLIKMTGDLDMPNTNFDNDPVTTTASDIATYFRKLYQGEVVSKGVSEKIIELLLLSKLNDRIPVFLPGEIKVVHKTGELSRVRHDGGIVYLEDNPYVIVMLSKDVEFEDETVETLANISKDVYDYFKGKDNK